MNKLLVKITENWPAKVLSVVLAIFIFVFHRMNGLENRFFSAPLRVELGGNMAAASPYPRMVRVRVRGEANSIYPIQEDDIEVYLDLKRYTEEGHIRVPVQIRRNGTALGLDPLEITVDPPEITLDLEKKDSKYVSISPAIDGYLEPGYELVSYAMTPAQVMVDGPRRLIDALEKLPTEAIDLGGRSEDFSSVLRILNRDPLLAIRGDGLTEFRGFVKKSIIIRGFEDLPILIDALDERFQAVTEISTGSIRIRGSQSELEHYTPEGTILRLDCSHIDAPGDYTLPVQAEMPEAFSLISSDPAEVTIQVQLKAGAEQ